MLDLEAYRIEAQGEAQDASLHPGDTVPLTPIDEFGANGFSEEEARALSEIIAAFNRRHGTASTEADYVRFEAVGDDMA